MNTSTINQKFDLEMAKLIVTEYCMERELPRSMCILLDEFTPLLLEELQERADEGGDELLKKVHSILSAAGVPSDGHGEETLLTLQDRVETLIYYRSMAEDETADLENTIIELKAQLSAGSEGLPPPASITYHTSYPTVRAIDYDALRQAATFAIAKERQWAEAAVRQLAANQCLHTIHGDEGGNPYCPRIKELEKHLATTNAVAKTAKRALQDWADRYGEWSAMMPDRMGSRLPPASHLEALSAMEYIL